MLMLFAQLCCFARALPVVSGGSRVGDLTESCKDMVAGKTLQELKQETEATAEMEVRDFLDLEVEVAGGRIIPIGRAGKQQATCR